MVSRTYWTSSFAIPFLLGIALGVPASTCTAQLSLGQENKPIDIGQKLSDSPLIGSAPDFKSAGSTTTPDDNSLSTRNAFSNKSGQNSGTLISNQLITPPNSNSPAQAVVQETVVPSEAIGGNNLVTGTFFFNVDFMFLERSGPSPQVLAFTDGVPSLNTTSFTYDPEFSVGVNIGIGDPYGYALEFNYFGSEHQFNGILAGGAVVPVFFGGIPGTPVPSYTVFAESQMSNYELNQWASVSNRARVGFGLRIIDMREEYNITETGSGNGFFNITDNELFGGQLTGQYIVFGNQIATIFLQGKVGGYYNHVSLKATSLNAQITPDTGEFSFVGDLKLVADMPITDIISFRIGYQATFLTNVAQAIDQNDNLSIFNPANPGQFDFSSPSYRGGFFGFVGSY